MPTVRIEKPHAGWSGVPFMKRMTSFSAIASLIAALICCSIAGLRLSDVIKDVMLMLLPMIGVLLLVIVWPQLVLFLPGLISPEFLK